MHELIFRILVTLLESPFPQMGHTQLALPESDVLLVGQERWSHRQQSQQARLSGKKSPLKKKLGRGDDIRKSGTHLDSGARLPKWKSWLLHSELYDLGQISCLLFASVSLSVKGEHNGTFL